MKRREDDDEAVCYRILDTPMSRGTFAIYDAAEAAGLTRNEGAVLVHFALFWNDKVYGVRNNRWAHVPYLRPGMKSMERKGLIKVTKKWIRLLDTPLLSAINQDIERRLNYRLKPQTSMVM